MNESGVIREKIFEVAWNISLTPQVMRDDIISLEWVDVELRSTKPTAPTMPTIFGFFSNEVSCTIHDE
jgi:hypothetical protein